MHLSPEATRRRPRVLQVVGTSLALPYQVAPIALALRSIGYDVDIASPSGPEAIELTQLGFQHLPFRLNRRLLAPTHTLTAMELRRIFAAREYDVIHIHGPLPGLIGRLVNAARGARVIYHCRGGTLFEEVGDVGFSAIAKHVYPWLERLLSRRTDVVFTLNETDARDFVQRANYRPEQVICLGVGGCGVDIDYWNREGVTASDLARIRKRFGLPHEHPVIGFVGRIVREKGVIELVEGFRRVRDAGLNAYLLIVGDTPASERDQEGQAIMRSLITSYRLTRFVVELGQLPSPRDAFLAMDVLCLPSHREGFGQVIAEAAALGIPSIAAESRGTRQAILHETTGFLFPRGDVDALSAYACRLMRDPDLRLRLGLNAAKRVRTEMSQSAVMARIATVYEQLLTHHYSRRAS